MIRTRRFRYFFWRILGLLLLLALLAGFAAYFFPQRILTVDSGVIKADVLIVLGGGGRERPGRAAKLFQDGAAPLVICTGIGDTGFNQSCLTNFGVPLTDIQLEPNARTTQENAKFTIAMLRARHAHSAIIVTSWYHSRRALSCFEHYAPEIKFYSRPSYFGYSRTEWKDTGVSSHIRDEYIKTLGYWICYGVCPL